MVQSGKSDETPLALDNASMRALFGNSNIAEGRTPALALQLSLELHAGIKPARPDHWREVLPWKNLIKQAM